VFSEVKFIIRLCILQLESGYGSEGGLRRHGSKLSLTSTASVSTISTSSFKVSGIIVYRNTGITCMHQESKKLCGMDSGSSSLELEVA